MTEQELDLELLAGIENAECFGGKNSHPREPLNQTRYNSGFPPTTPEQIAKRRQEIIDSQPKTGTWINPRKK